MGAAHIFLLVHGDSLFSSLHHGWECDPSFFMHTSLYYCLASDVLDHQRNFKPPYVLHMGVRSVVNKKKQTMLYPWLFLRNVVDTIFDVRGLCDDGFRRQEREGARAWRRSSALRRSVGLTCFFFLSAAWPCICMCSRLVSMESVHQPCSLSFYVQQISFHVGSLLLCFLSFCMPISFHAWTSLRILGANVSRGAELHANVYEVD
jgi:hypothetical protein